MDKETVALIIAQNGLGTAATILLAKKLKLEKQLAKAKPEELEAIRKKVVGTEKLAIALKAANDGINQYNAEVAAL